MLRIAQIHHDGGKARTIRHRRVHPFGKRRPRGGAAGRALAGMGAMFGRHRRRWRRQVDHLPRRMAGGRSRVQCLATVRTGRRIVVRPPHPASGSAGVSHPDVPSGRRSCALTARAGCASAASSPVRHWRAACRCCCGRAQAGAPDRQSAPPAPLRRPCGSPPASAAERSARPARESRGRSGAPEWWNQPPRIAPSGIFSASALRLTPRPADKAPRWRRPGIWAVASFRVTGFHMPLHKPVITVY